MRSYFVVFLIILTVGCKNKSEHKKMDENLKSETVFYVGTYTNKKSKGIYKYKIATNGKLTKIGLVANVANPTFLVKSKDKQNIFVIGETDKNNQGVIRSYKIQKDSLQLISKEATGGPGPCFVGINDDNYIVAANYRGGNVGLLKADNTGALSKLLYTQQHAGKGTTARQEAPHAHSAWFHPNKDEVISLDLGTNQLWFSKIDKTTNTLVPTTQKTLSMAMGAGPRHLTFHPNKRWIYVLNELNNTVSLVKEKEAEYYVDSSVPMLPKDFKKFSKAADIHVSKDGQFLYASNRGHESIVVYKIDAVNGSLTTIAHTSVLGVHPRNFSLSPDNKFLLVANRDTDNIVCFKRDALKGTLTFVSEIAAPTPVCILF